MYGYSDQQHPDDPKDDVRYKVNAVCVTEALFRDVLYYQNIGH